MDKTWKAAGLMSGTSLDGLDVVLCEFVESSGSWNYKFHYGVTIPFPDDLRSMLKDAPSKSAFELVKLDLFFGAWCGDRLWEICQEQCFEPLLVASHGHTIFHQPEQGVTLQIGNGHSLAQHCGRPVIADFRSADVLRGGQGAPLVPVGDHLLFNHFRACLNLGGIANISYSSNEERLAFDIAPCNLVLNYLAGRLDKEYDYDGILAASGSLMSDLLEYLDHWSYYSLKPPKSLAREQIEHYVFPKLSQTIPPENLLHTFTVHAARQIALVVNNLPPGEVLITGGGAHNSFFVNTLRNCCNKNLVIPDSGLVDYKEALVFALLGVLRWSRRTNIFASVTGADLNLCSGVIYLPPRPLC